MDIKTYQYQGFSVAFLPGDGKGVMVNATQMASPFGKKISHFLRDELRRNMVMVLCERNSLKYNDAQIRMSLFASTKIENWADIYPESIKVVKGGSVLDTTQGTWVHEDIAMELARWLNPSFAVWCNDRIKELLQHGFTGTDQFLENLLNNPDETIKALTRVSEALISERRKNEVLAEQLSVQRPKVDYAETVLSSSSHILSTIIAKELGIGPIILHKKLQDLGIIRRVGGTWVLTYQYQNRGLTSTNTFSYKTASGDTKTAISLVWTEIGRMFIHDLLGASLKNPQ